MDLVQACCDSPRLFDTILSCIQHAIIVTDLKGHVLFATPAVEKTFGFAPDELKDKNLSILFTPEDLTHLYPGLLYMAQKNKPFEGEVKLIRKDETRFFAFMVFRPYFDPGQGKPLIVISVRDIDKEKRPEKAFRDTHYEDLVKIADGIAHELRNPLVGIGGFVNRLYESRRDTSDHDKYYDYIINNVKKLEGLVEKVEFFARLPKPRLTKESIRELIQEALQPYLQQMEARKIDLSTSMDEVILLVDRDLVIRAFSILIENALDALPGGGKINIDSQAEDNQCKICIIDTGSGIAPKDLPHIFNPFFRTKPDGVGIDLAVVKRIMDSHGGRVEVKSKQGEGTTFSLVFPLERRRPVRIARLQD